MTWYDDAPGLTQGERIELSGRVLDNWVAKTANLLVDELGLEPGDPVWLDLPPHWRLVTWALGCWSAGALVCWDDAEAAAVVSANADVLATATAEHRVAVALPGLARSWADELPAGCVDGAAELGRQGDFFAPQPEPAADWANAVADAAARLAPRDRVLVTTSDPAELLLAVLAAWSVDGSVVVVNHPTTTTTTPATTAPIPATRLAAEQVTHHWKPAPKEA